MGCAVIVKTMLMCVFAVIWEGCHVSIRFLRVELRTRPTCSEVIYNIPHLIFHTRHRAPTIESVHPAGAFVLQHPSKKCSADTMLTTIAECSSVKTVLAPRAAGVTVEDYAKAPKGCSRADGEWYFNTHTEGALDGESEPVCKIIAGEPLLPHQTHTCTLVLLHSMPLDSTETMICTLALFLFFSNPRIRQVVTR